MMKKLLTLLLVFSLCLTLAVPVFATETEEVTEIDYNCGEDMTWQFADGTLTITGSGSMDDFEESAPWEIHKDAIKRVVLKGKISYIGARAFTDYDALETVNFGLSLYEIGTEAFKSCDGLTVIYLPSSFKVFGESSFASCSALSAIHCSGSFPKFRQNCLWNTYGTIYYPADKPWSREYIEQLETAFKGRIDFVSSDKAEQVTDPTEPPTEAPTEAPTLPPTEAPTVAPTEAPRPTEAVTVPVTEAPTVPATEAATEPAPEIPEETESKSWIGLVIIGAVAAFVLMGTIVVGLSSRRGRYSKKRRKR